MKPGVHQPQAGAHIVYKYSTREHVNNQNTAQGEAKCSICLETPLSAVLIRRTSISGTLINILYFQLLVLCEDLNRAFR